jgi:hypothetical protein
MSGLHLPAIVIAAIIAFGGAPGAACAAVRGTGSEAVAPAKNGAEAGGRASLSSPPRLWPAAAGAKPGANDYPTSERADYVIGCMAANGNTREALLKCSCAIDTIAALMPYSDYERAETALSLQLGGGVGGRVGLFRDPPQIKAVIEQLRRAQAEANLQCR